MATIMQESFDSFADVARMLYIYGCLSNECFDDEEVQKQIRKSIILSANYRLKMGTLERVLRDDINAHRVKQRKSENERGKICKYISRFRFSDEGRANPFSILYRIRQVRKDSENRLPEYYEFLSSMKSASPEIIDYFGDDCTAESLFTWYLPSEKPPKLTTEELHELYYAVMFYLHKAPYSVSGHFICEHINQYLNLTGVDAVCNHPFDITYHSMDRILDDKAVYLIFTAIAGGKTISLIDRNQERKQKHNSTKSKNTKFYSERVSLFPLKIIYEYQNGRGFLFAWHFARKDFALFRLDDVFQVTIDKRLPDQQEICEIREKSELVYPQMLYSYKGNERTHVVVDFDLPATEISALLPIESITATSDNSCRLDTNICNRKDLIPILRRFGTKAHISIDESPALYNEIRDDLKEALKNYGVL